MMYTRFKHVPLDHQTRFNSWNILALVLSESICRRQKNVVLIDENIFDSAENMMGKGENAGYQQFLLFPKCFQKFSLLGLLKLWIFLQWVKLHLRNSENILEKKMVVVK